jgi:hypothetical protein
VDANRYLAIPIRVDEKSVEELLLTAKKRIIIGFLTSRNIIMVCSSGKGWGGGGVMRGKCGN